MRFIVRWAFYAFGAFTCLVAGAQPYLMWLFDRREPCINLPNHAAIQECQKQQKAEYTDWEKQMKDRYPSPPPRLNGADEKLPMNCFKRESTGEKICAN